MRHRGRSDRRTRPPHLGAVKGHEEPIGQSDWHLTIVEVSAGPHFMSNPSGDAFGIMVYAYDRDVSYAFPGGLNLLKR